MTLFTLTCQTMSLADVTKRRVLKFLPDRVMPESVRWLVLQKRHSAALAVIQQAAKLNKVATLDSTSLLAQVKENCGS